MTQRISSPEELNNRTKVNGVEVWIALFILITTVIVGMVIFLSNEIVMHESHSCYVSEVSKPSVDALYEIINLNSSYSTSVTKDLLEKEYAEIIKPGSYSQSVYFLVDNLEESEMVEGMTFYIGDNAGYVASIPGNPMEYEDMFKLGIQEKEMRKAGLKPGHPYYMVTAFLINKNPNPVLMPGFYMADVILDIVDPISFILK